MNTLAALRARKVDDVTADTLRLRSATDQAWREPFHKAYRKITWAVQTGMAYTWIRVPFPFDDDANDLCEWLANYWASFGFGLRPGGSAGWAEDIVRLERSL